MTTLSEPILASRGNPDRGFWNDYIVTGGSDVIEEKIKAMGWTGRSPVATVGLHVEDGAITDTQLFLSGTRLGDRIGADLMFGPPLTDDSYIKLEALDLALFSIHGRMVSDWVSSDKTDWVLKIHNSDTGRFKIINKLDQEGLIAKGADKFYLRQHLALDKGPKLTSTLGVAPTSNLLNMVGNGNMNFPMIKLGKDVKVKFFPSEPEGADLGLGFVPFFIVKDAPAEGLVLPNMNTVREAVAELLNTSCKAKTNAKFTTWKQSASLGRWDVLEPTYVWPSGAGAEIAVEEDEEEGQSNTETLNNLDIQLG